MMRIYPGQADISRCIYCEHLIGVVHEDGVRCVRCSLPWPPCQFEPRQGEFMLAFCPPGPPEEQQAKEPDA